MHCGGTADGREAQRAGKASARALQPRGSCGIEGGENFKRAEPQLHFSQGSAAQHRGFEGTESGAARF
eukprot:3661034-Rhodomonas_salina.1